MTRLARNPSLGGLLGGFGEVSVWPREGISRPNTTQTAIQGIVFCPSTNCQQQGNLLLLGSCFAKMSIPDTMQAVKVRAPSDIFLEEAAPRPSLRPGYLLIRVLSIALNPTDWKGAAIFKGDKPHTIGCDAAGLVAECSEEASRRFKPGDRVAGLCYGMKPGDPTSGAYGEYALLKEALTLHVPDHVSDSEAATIPVGINTVGQGAISPAATRLVYHSS